VNDQSAPASAHEQNGSRGSAQKPVSSVEKLQQNLLLRVAVHRQTVLHGVPFALGARFGVQPDDRLLHFHVPPF
jgi:hypothetical protein